MWYVANDSERVYYIVAAQGGAINPVGNRPTPVFDAFCSWMIMIEIQNVHDRPIILTYPLKIALQNALKFSKMSKCPKCKMPKPFSFQFHAIVIPRPLVLVFNFSALTASSLSNTTLLNKSLRRLPAFLPPTA